MSPGFSGLGVQPPRPGKHPGLQQMLSLCESMKKLKAAMAVL